MGGWVWVGGIIHDTDTHTDTHTHTHTLVGVGVCGRVGVSPSTPRSSLALWPGSGQFHGINAELNPKLINAELNPKLIAKLNHKRRPVGGQSHGMRAGRHSQIKYKIKNKNENKPRRGGGHFHRMCVRRHCQIFQAS